MDQEHGPEAAVQAPAARFRPRPRRRPRLGTLEPLLPNAGRAKAGADTAAKRKAKSLAAVSAAITQLERADRSRRPDVGEVARVAKTSSATVRRCCEYDPSLMTRIAFRQPRDTKASDLVKELKADIRKLEKVVVSLSSRNRALQHVNQKQLEQLERLKTEARHRDTTWR
jgi:hypothetical protein